MAAIRSCRVALRLSEHHAIRIPFPHSRIQNIHNPLISATTTATPSRSSVISQRFFSGTSAAFKEDPASNNAPARKYTFAEIQDLSSSPSPNRILIDVREPSELQSTGRIPSAKSMPIGSSPDAVFMSAEDFEDKFGFSRPGPDDEVIFYCKAGVRSRQAGQLAGQASPQFGGKIGNYEGSWLEWEKNGGKVEKA